jgi:hypothetical protein
MLPTRRTATENMLATGAVTAVGRWGCLSLTAKVRDLRCGFGAPAVERYESPIASTIYVGTVGATRTRPQQDRNSVVV